MLDVLETTTVLAKYPENGRINKPAVTKPPPKPRFPIRVEDLEEYIMSRKANDCEELRKEYMVCILYTLMQFTSFFCMLRVHCLLQMNIGTLLFHFFVVSLKL